MTPCGKKVNFRIPHYLYDLYDKVHLKTKDENEHLRKSYKTHKTLPHPPP